MATVETTPAAADAAAADAAADEGSTAAATASVGVGEKDPEQMKADPDAPASIQDNDLNQSKDPLAENTSHDQQSAKAENEPNNGSKGSKRSDQNDRYSIKVKAEYILDQRPTSLPPLPSIVGEDNDAAQGDEQDDAGDNNHGGNKRNKNKKKKDKREKKKRPRDARESVKDNFCSSIFRNEPCPFGAKCRYSHDLKLFLADRPPDLTQVETGCPHYNLYGFCMYGASCRLGSSHLNLATGESLQKTVEKQPDPVLNILDKNVQAQLRKKTYPFVTQRNDSNKKAEEKKQSPDGTDSKPAVEASTDLSPLPSKTRKIIDFSNKVYVAPLTTVGNLPFRRIMKKMGADITCGEMAMAANILSGQASEWALLKRHPEEDIFGVQIAAGYPDLFGRTCELIEKHVQVDFVDLNLGCPLDIVNTKGCGAALMMRHNRLQASLESIGKVLSCPITIKMRTGWDMNKPIAHELVPRIQSWNMDNIAAIMIHGRSRLQRYAKEADWDYIQQVAKSQSPDLPQIPIIGNGDIFSHVDHEEKCARDGISSCAMLARGALIKPWLPTEIKEKRHWDISATERLDILKDFVRFGLEHWGSDQQGVNKCRRFLLEWLSFLHRYVPVGLLEVLPQGMNQRPPLHMCGRNDLETLFLSNESPDWIRISEMLLGPVPDGFRFEPKHNAKSYSTEG